MKRLLTLAFAASMAFATASVATAEPLKIGMAPEPYPPFEWKEADGTWKGFEIDFGKALCAKMGEECVIVEIAWDGIIPALQAKKIDMILNSMTITEERQKIIDFSVPYYSTGASFIGPKGTTLEPTAESLQGKVIGVQAATTHAAYVEEKFKDVAEIRTYPTQDEANADLIAGRLDTVVADKVALDEFLKSADASGLAMLADVPAEDGGDKHVGIAIRKEDAALKAKVDAAITEIVKSGEYDQLAKPYFNFDIYGLPRQ
ncbi:transporter substrate-binding domain-containing protein [Rhizobiaceae bacterium n13]|uniref:Transporter substrate-binding domain-containing protein n=1 Tax=Ferirhizobium litorale TaxID=2927786 RepID=A0AAE3U4E9_9HYPH|nr:transporter substrate-binding domain-containing protein [Fererhizobium litorale]MDI7864457.1 transporter substrate-binding domain-containing protein [Fererhizobium litorale]MDI7924792.1 transporter substrate-binding domain-containing protein [Fererhizobium litorale]